MTSRSTTLRALLGCALLAGVHLLAVAVLAVQLLLIVAIMTAHSWQLSLLGSLTIAPVATLAYGLLAGTSNGVADGPRIELTPLGQPELWAMTLRLARELDTAPPTTIRLADSVNACASERSRLLGLIGGPRTLDLGLPLLLGLSRDELRAVLCHELGHYAGRHTRLAAVSHRGSVALERTVRYLEAMETDQTTVKPPVRLLLKLTRTYNRAYLRQTLAVRRSQELEADRAAAGVAGAHTFARALRTVHALAPLWDDLAANPGRPAGPTGAGPPLPEGVFRAFSSRLAGLGDLGSAVLNVVPEDGLGSHPPLADRLAALCPDCVTDGAHRPSVTAVAPAAELLRDLPELVEALQVAMDPSRSATSAPAGGTLSMTPPRVDKAILRFKLTTFLIGLGLVLAAGVVVNTVISPPGTDPPPFTPPPSMPHVWPVGGSPPPVPLPTFTFAPLPSPSTLPLLPSR